MGFIALAALLVIVLILFLWSVGTYNSLIRLRNEVKNAWAQIDVQLKRRHDLIPNLVETTKGYMHHERETLEAVIKARQQAVQIEADSTTPEQTAQLESAISQSLKSLFAVAENYPELKANENFLALQEELTSTENKIGFARQFYNDSVLKFNNLVEFFPSNLVAGMFRFQTKGFFELESPTERQVPQVSF